MRLAVTYDQGEVFPHFGKTRFFQLYQITDGQVTGYETVSAGGAGHGALAGFLQSHGVDTLICGGLGEGARAALEAADIRIFAGVSGSAEQAVQDLLAGRLHQTGEAVCDRDHAGHGHHGQHDGACCGRHAGHHHGHQGGDGCGCHA